MKKYRKYLNNHKSQKDLSDFQKEHINKPFPDTMNEDKKPYTSNRRNFLKMLGYTIGYAGIAARCEMPVRKAIPYLNQPEEIIPGIANYYASTFDDGHDYCSIMVKTREGRPIKIEGNEGSPITQGGTHARIQASVLNLYDNTRLKTPLKNGEISQWEKIDSEIISILEQISKEGKEIVLLTSTTISPSTKELIQKFSNKYKQVCWLSYDAISMQAMRKANLINFGEAFIPSYNISKAKLIMGFNADFLGNWISPTAFTKQYSAVRNLLYDSKSMLRHIQFESFFSITGGMADERIPIKPSEEAPLMLNIYNTIAKTLNQPTFKTQSVSIDYESFAKELLKYKGKSIVLSGTNDLNIQLICNAINYLLTNYNQTIDLNKHCYFKQGDDQSIKKIIQKIQEGKVGAVIHHNVNPVYDDFNADAYKEAISKVNLSISTAETLDETAVCCSYVCPNHNYLESWNDAEPQKGVFSTQQPTIRNIFNTRQFQDSILRWMGEEKEYVHYIRNFWEENIFPLQSTFSDFRNFWNKCIHDGIFITESKVKNYFFKEVELKIPQYSSKDGLELILYEKTGIGNGKYANNPWLQELPDPITMATWDNYLCISPIYAEENGLETEDVVRINNQFELPVLVQVGMPQETAAIALGYGRSIAGKVAKGLGQNAFPLVFTQNGYKSLTGNTIHIEKIKGKTYALALTQEHHTMEGRDLVRETTFKNFLVNSSSGNEKHAKDAMINTSLYDKPEFKGFHWGMAIDLNACTGCGNCVISCQVENNIAVIGKEQVKKRRIMHWIRIDRYYFGNKKNPELLHQPVMCQHCDNAPCENVCPVAATPHSGEGLNQMAYNRCIGTRYCMNNCPYRVRRFNWFEYANNKDFDYNKSMNSDIGKLVLNPDVVVRSRGVVEKCSYCVQRIQEKKLEAKEKNLKLRDGEIKTACQQSCPANAIIFGDLLNPESEIFKIQKNPRMYHLLEHVHTLPSTSYLTKIRNKNN